MIPYIVKEMLRHLVLRLVLSATFIALGKKGSLLHYNVELIKQQEREILVSAALIGVAFGAVTIFLVVMIKGQDSIWVVIAGIMLSIGLSQQVMSLGLDVVTLSLSGYLSSWTSVLNCMARQKSKPEWHFIENETNQIFINPHVMYILPSELDEPKAPMENIIKYIDEHRWELEFPLVKVYGDDPSLLSFAQYATEYIRSRLLISDRLVNIQQRSGAINPIVFIALGTLMWLLS